MDDQQADSQNTTQTQESAVPKDNPAKDVIKSQAVSALLPLVEELEGSPQRKFEILITAARTADDSGLLQKALSAAMQIDNPTEKAEALLDVINEASV